MRVRPKKWFGNFVDSYTTSSFTQARSVQLLNIWLSFVKVVIMNDPDTVMVTSKQTGFCPTHYANDILGNLSREIRLAWCTMSPPPPPPAP